MKQKSFIVAGIIVILAAMVLIRLRIKPEIPPPPKTITTTATADGMNLKTETDPTQVFQKAFWRHPTSGDEILHAERREWSTEEGVKKWQWFIALRPGTELLEWLKTNPFSMTKTNSSGDFEKPPEWFPNSSTDFQIQRNAQGSFVLMLSADKKRLYATDSGLGFNPPGIAP